MMPMARTTAGRINSLVGAAGLTVGLTQPSLTPSTYWATKATTKIGSEKRISDVKSAVTSTMPFCFSPE